MTDFCDRASELEEKHREEAIRVARIAASFAPRDPSVDAICHDCDKPIEPDRLRTLNTIRCRACAHAAVQRWGVR